jgi:hypothetical protein
LIHITHITSELLSLYDLDDQYLPSKSSETTYSALSGQRLMWPLFTAGAFLDSADPMKRWTIQILAKIADITGFQQAAHMSQALVLNIVE